MKTISNDSNRIKLLLVSPLPNEKAFGGIGTWTIRFTNHIKNNNKVEFEVVDNTPVDKKGNDIARSKNVLKKIACNYRIFKKFKKRISLFKPNIVHFNTSCTPFACLRDWFFLKYCKRKKIKTVLHCRCNIEDQINCSAIGEYFFGRNAKMASAVLTLNSYSFEYVHKKIAESVNVFVVPNFVEKSFVVSERFTNKRLSNVIFVGHLVKQKGIEDIVFLAEKYKYIHFTLVGGFTEEYPNYQYFPENVEITGNLPIDLVTKKIDESDLFLFPTYTEGFSNALLEAMARGLPVIATNVGANNDMIENKGGIIVNPKNHIELFLALANMKKHDVRAAMSKWNIDKVNEFYLSDVVINKIIKIYFDLL